MGCRVGDASTEQLRQGAFGRAAKDRRNAYHAASNIHSARKLSARRRNSAAQDRRTPPQSRGVGFEDPFVAGKSQRAGRLLKHLRGQPIFQCKEGTLPRPVTTRVFETGGEEALKTRNVAGLENQVGAARHGHDRFRRVTRQLRQPASPRRDVARRGQPSMSNRQGLQARERCLRACAATNIGRGVGEIGKLVECEHGFEVDACAPEGELTFRARIDECKLQRTFGPALEFRLLGVCRNRRPGIAKSRT